MRNIVHHDHICKVYPKKVVISPPLLYVSSMNPSPSYTFGYARVSTADQDPALQIEALKRYGIPEDQIYQETASGGRMDRKELAKIRKILRDGDTLVVWKLDRLGRTVAGVVEAIEWMHDAGIHFVSLTEKIDTSSPMGKAIFHIMAAMAQLERDLISERTKAGMAIAKAAGKRFGKAHMIKDNPKRLAEFERMFQTGEVDDLTAREVIARLNAADPKAAKIKAPETFRKWAREGFPGANLRDTPLDETEVETPLGADFERVWDENTDKLHEQ